MSATRHWMFTLCILVGCYISDVYSTSITKTLSDAIFTGYDKGLRPNCPGFSAINSTLGIALRQIVNLDEPAQIIKVNMWIRMKWIDCSLQWNPSDYNNTDKIVVPVSQIWKPDLTLYDSIENEIPGINNYNTIIDANGTVIFNFPTVLEVLCPIDVANFPFDTQSCPLMFGSWAYHGLELDFQPRDNPGDLSSYKENVEWTVNTISLKRNVLIYGCCPEPYVDITFYLNISRKPSYYVTNIITPCIMIVVLAVFGYLLPVESGEKASLMITVMLAMSVFQLLVADKLPPSADATPWLMIFFNFILGLSAVSTVIQVIVINVYFRGELEMSQCLKTSVVVPLCCLTRVTIPGSQPCCSSNNKNKVEMLSNDKPSTTNTELWQSFAVAIDRVGIVFFTLTLSIGCAGIFNNIKDA